MKTLALFDFDHTLYKGDSMLDFTKSQSAVAYYVGLLYLLPRLLGMKLGFLSNQKVKERFLTHFFGGFPVEEIERLGKKFAKSIPAKLSDDMQKSLQRHLSDGDTVAIVTASLPFWIEAWSASLDIRLISSLPQVEKGVFTGKLQGKNCYGKEKENRIRDVFDLEAFDRIFAYGAGKGDVEMLALARQ